MFVDHPYRVEAEVTGVDDALVHTVGRVVGGEDTTLVSSISTFHIVGEVDVATGENTLDERHRGLVEGDDV